jgi:pimeloyl-ACP methyl ester carboxylesterase
VYFPSLDGSPHNAALLVKCERFPLVLFIHGDCGGDPFQHWIALPAQLARSGYVVAVTGFGGVPADGNPATTAPLRAVHDFMRTTWEFRERLMPPPNTAVMGHSFGGTLAAQLANEIPVAAFTSLSGTFGQAQNPIGLPDGIGTGGTMPVDQFVAVTKSHRAVLRKCDHGRAQMPHDPVHAPVGRWRPLALRDERGNGAMHGSNGRT